MTKNQTRFITLMLLAAVGLMIGIGYLGYQRDLFQKTEDEAAARKSLEEGMARQREAAKARPSLPGDVILQNYAQPNTRPQEDLEALAHTFSNLALLIKGDSPFRMGANEEFAAALLGKNRTQLRFISDGHRALNDKGQLIDRWGTPLYFHTTAHDRIDIRSAGPDHVMWTADDLHRKYDGSFLKGESLNPASLFQEQVPGSKPR